jgi:hypothetical protein
MNTRPAITLQINLAPTDLPHAQYILPHQLRQWGGQVDEVVLVLDLHRSPGRYSEAWEERLPGMRLLLEQHCREYPHARAVEVDYSPATAAHLSRLFFGGCPIPAKDWNGAPFYAYLFGLYAAEHDYVFHLDSDMLFGGGSATWAAEAVALLSERPDALSCSPLPGPPTADGQLRSQSGIREAVQSPAFRFPHLSTRLFFMDRQRFLTRIKALPVVRPVRHRLWQAQVRGHPPYETLEGTFSHAMAKHGLVRIDFLGRHPGMWSVHPPYRSSLFYGCLPDLIQQIECGDIPEGQRGHHDMNDSMVDWSSVRAVALSPRKRAVRCVAENLGRLYDTVLERRPARRGY